MFEPVLSLADLGLYTIALLLGWAWLTLDASTRRSDR